jgi:signal transduction histidine kinase/DNA-binding response OmpR family regulator
MMDTAAPTILLVEDEAAHAAAIERALKAANPQMKVKVAGTLREYRQLTSALPTQMAIVDLNLPDGRAFEILTAPPETGPFPVLIMTSYGSEQLAVEAMKSGALDYIVKSPETFAEMPRIVDRVLREWRLLEERKQARARIEHLNRVLRAIRDVSQLILRETSAERLIQGACDLMVSHRSYGSALIVLIDEAGRAGSYAKAGMAKTFQPLDDDLSRGRLPACCVKARAQPGVHHVADRSRECADCSIVEECAASDSLCIVLRHMDKSYGCMAVAVDHHVAEDPEEQALFAQMAGDLAYALHNLAAQQAIQAADEARSNLEAQLFQAQKMEAVGRLAGGVAHDFNNLLSVILGYAEIVVEDLSGDHPHRDSLKEIYNAAVRAKNVTRQLLAFSRKQVLEMEMIDINTLVSGFEKLLRRIIGEDIDLVLSLAPAAGYVKADMSQLEQVIMNLAINARDAMPEGGTLTIETAVVDLDEVYTFNRPDVSPGTYAMIAVSDTGIGMDRDTLSRLFEPFFTTKDKDRGTGLGLATTYGIVKQHGGSIWVYSEPGQGSVFRIYLPLSAMEAEVPASKRERLQTLGGTATILVVEDDLAVRKLTCNILAGKGYRVIAAESAQDAVTLAEKYRDPIHLLVTDVIMPGLKGPEVLRRIAQFHPAARVLYMSGYTADMITRQGVLNEGLQFIQKPFTISALLEKVAHVLG